MDVESSSVDLEGEDGAVEVAFVAAGGEPAPCVIVVPDVDGNADDLARDAQERLAGAGLAVARLGSLALADRAGTRALERVGEALARRDDVDGDRLGVLGFGRGGTLAWLFACSSRLPSAVVLWSASLVHEELSADRPTQPLELALNLTVPTLGVWFASADGPPRDAEALRAVGSQFALACDTLVVAPEEGRPVEGGSSGGRATAWSRVVDAFREHLEVGEQE